MPSATRSLTRFCANGSTFRYRLRATMLSPLRRDHFEGGSDGLTGAWVPWSRRLRCCHSRSTNLAWTSGMKSACWSVWLWLSGIYPPALLCWRKAGNWRAWELAAMAERLRVAAPRLRQHAAAVCVSRESTGATTAAGRAPDGTQGGGGLGVWSETRQ